MDDINDSNQTEDFHSPWASLEGFDSEIVCSLNVTNMFLMWMPYEPLHNICSSLPETNSGAVAGIFLNSGNTKSPQSLFLVDLFLCSPLLSTPSGDGQRIYSLSY